MSQEQCGHTQGDDLHCSGCGHTWKEIYAEARSEYRKTLEKINKSRQLLSDQYNAAYRSIQTVGHAMENIRNAMGEVDSAIQKFQEVEAKWPERGVPI